MGLDNFPHRYLCKVQETAVLIATSDENEQIDCSATIAAGGCPFMLRKTAENPGQAVLGMFGTPCWYRGKAGQWMLDRLEKAGATLPAHLKGGFYGDGEKTPNLSPRYCAGLAAFMEKNIAVYRRAVQQELVASGANPIQVERTLFDELEEYRYAAWWLRFVGQETGGCEAWY